MFSWKQAGTVFALLAVAACERDMRKGDDLAKVGQPAPGEPKQKDPNLPPAARKQEASPPPAHRIPAGTEFTVKTAATLSTQTAATGDRFRATLLTPIASADGTVLATAGTPVGGLIFATSDGTRLRRKVEIELRIVTLEPAGAPPIDVRTISYIQEGGSGGRLPAVVPAGTEIAFKLASEIHLRK